MSACVGLLDQITVQGKKSLVACLNCDIELQLAFESDEKLEQTKRILLDHIGQIVEILLDENGVPHVLSLTGGKNTD